MLMFMKSAAMNTKKLGSELLNGKTISADVQRSYLKKEQALVNSPLYQVPLKNGNETAIKNLFHEFEKGLSVEEREAMNFRNMAEGQLHGENWGLSKEQMNLGLQQSPEKLQDVTVHGTHVLSTRYNDMGDAGGVSSGLGGLRMRNDLRDVGAIAAAGVIGFSAVAGAVNLVRGED